MFNRSCFDVLQDYIASGCNMQLTEEEQQYYNALYTLVGINRKYGKDNAIAFLTHAPFNVERTKARRMYAEAINLFYIGDRIENDAHRNMLFDNMMKAAAVVLENATSSKDMEVYGNLTIQAAKIKQLDKPDPVKPKEMDEKPIKVYDLDPGAVGLPSVNRKLLAQQIDDILGLNVKDKNRLKRDAGVLDVDIEEVLDGQQESFSKD